MSCVKKLVRHALVKKIRYVYRQRCKNMKTDSKSKSDKEEDRIRHREGYGDRK